MPEDETKRIGHRIDTVPDYICVKRFGFSLEKLLERYPDGVPDDERGIKIIAQALQIPEAEVQPAIDRAVKALRTKMKVRV